MQARRIQIDALKAVGSHMIVLHHLVAYGPVSDALAQALPALMGWLFDYGRMAVHIFLVLGGYLAVAALEPTARARTGSLPQTLLRRYQRLVLPFLVAVLICMATAEAVRPWLTADLLPGPPTWSQVLAHVFLLHSVLDFDSLSGTAAPRLPRTGPAPAGALAGGGANAGIAFLLQPLCGVGCMGLVFFWCLWAGRCCTLDRTLALP